MKTKSFVKNLNLIKFKSRIWRVNLQNYSKNMKDASEDSQETQFSM